MWISYTLNEYYQRVFQRFEDCIGLVCARRPQSSNTKTKRACDLYNMPRKRNTNSTEEPSTLRSRHSYSKILKSVQNEAQVGDLSHFGLCRICIVEGLKISVCFKTTSHVGTDVIRGLLVSPDVRGLDVCSVPTKPGY